MIASYEKTQGPGTTWQEPIVLGDHNVARGGTLTVSSWHRSFNANVAAVTVGVGGTSFILQNVRTYSRGHHLATGSGGCRLIARNSRFYGLNPMMQGKSFGRAVVGDYANQFEVVQCYAERTSGIKGQYFWGRAAGCIKITQNLFHDIDGRYVNADGSYVESAWWSSHGTLPAGARLGAETAQFFYIKSLIEDDDPPVAADVGIGGCEISWNECINRPGYAVHEDLLNFHALRGLPNDPIRVHHNTFWLSGPWDFHWHRENRQSRPYNFGKILSLHTDGVTQSGPDYYSGTGQLYSDLFANDDELFKQPQHVDGLNNLVIGVSGIVSVQSGTNQRVMTTHLVSSGKMMSGLAEATQNRRAGIQITNYTKNSSQAGKETTNNTTVQTITVSAACAA